MTHTGRTILWTGLVLAVCACLPAAAAVPAVRLEPAFPELRFARPVDLVFAPAAVGTAYVLEQHRGRVRVFDPAEPGAHRGFLDLGDRLVRQRVGNEEGLLAMALAPDFADSGVFYLYYIGPRPSHGILSRFHADDPRGRVDPASEEVLLRVAQPYRNHNGADLLFGPDGMLYLSLGDGGAADDPKRHGQNLGTLLGSVLRLQLGAEGGYAVPADNPFVDTPGAREEIYAYGLRNTWRMSIDPATGVLWAGDVGQNAWEEIDHIVAGGNYGWNVYEGPERFARAPRGLRVRDPVAPVFSYRHGTPDGGRSVTGGHVYRGADHPSLVGYYLCADYVSGNVYALPADDPGAGGVVLRDAPPISSFARDPAGELYALDHGGRILRVVGE